MKLYFAIFAVHKEREFEIRAGYIFATNRLRMIEKLRETYGPLTDIKSAEEIEIQEGTILYGKCWAQLRGGNA